MIDLKENVIREVHERIKQSEPIPEVLDEGEKKTLENQGIRVDEDYFNIDFEYNASMNEFLDHNQLTGITVNKLREEGYIVYKANSPYFKFNGTSASTQTYEIKKQSLYTALYKLCDLLKNKNAKRIVVFKVGVRYESPYFDENLIVRMHIID